MKGALVLLAVVLVGAACTSHSDDTWIRPGIGRVPSADAADAQPSED